MPPVMPPGMPPLRSGCQDANLDIIGRNKPCFIVFSLIRGRIWTFLEVVLVPQRGLLGATRLAPPGSPRGRSNWPTANLSNRLVVCQGLEPVATSIRTPMSIAGFEMIGAAKRIRTPDPRITNALLYQLSYCGFAVPKGRHSNPGSHPTKGCPCAASPRAAPAAGRKSRVPGARAPRSPPYRPTRAAARSRPAPAPRAPRPPP